MDAMTQSDHRTEGYAVMTGRLMGVLAREHTPTIPAERIAFLEGMLSALDKTRTSLVEDIEACARQIERNNSAAEA